MLNAPLRAVLLILLLVGAKLLPWPALIAVAVGLLLPIGLLANRTRRTPIRGARVLVTGASSGLGRALARDAARRGAAQVILVSRSRDRLQETADLIGPAALVRPCDVTDPDQIQALADQLIADGQLPDVLINNAGAGSWDRIEEGTLADVGAHMDCPYGGAAMLTRALAPALIARGSGHVVNVTSLASIGGFRGAGTYGAARWAVRGFSGFLRADLEGAGVGVTLLNAAEVSGTNYFSAENAGAESYNRIPLLFQHPIVRALSKDTEQTAAECLDGVERGVFEVLSPWYLAAPTKLAFDLFPEVMHYLLRVGPAGRRN